MQRCILLPGTGVTSTGWSKWRSWSIVGTDLVIGSEARSPVRQKKCSGRELKDSRWGLAQRADQRLAPDHASAGRPVGPSRSGTSSAFVFASTAASSAWFSLRDELIDRSPEGAAIPTYSATARNEALSQDPARVGDVGSSRFRIRRVGGTRRVPADLGKPSIGRCQLYRFTMRPSTNTPIRRVTVACQSGRS